MKAKIIRGTTIGLISVKEGDVVEIDDASFSVLKSQGQAEAFLEIPPEAEPPKKSKGK